MNEKWFENWFNSPYYHLLYKKRDGSDADFFIRNLLSHLQPLPDSRMLDVACGKGRHSILMAQSGYDVTGIDISENSIAEALLHENERLHFYTHDMRQPFRFNYFDYAFNFFTSFGYFHTQRENQNAINSIAGSLKPSGIFMIDYLNTHKAISSMKKSDELMVGNVRFNISRWHDDKKIYKKIEVFDETNRKELTFMEEVEKFSIADFEKLFKPGQLQISGIFGDYDLSPFNPDNSPRLILLAGKNA